MAEIASAFYQPQNNGAEGFALFTPSKQTFDRDTGHPNQIFAVRRYFSLDRGTGGQRRCDRRVCVARDRNPYHHRLA
jgi:hypothetical protein